MSDKTITNKQKDTLYSIMKTSILLSLEYQSKSEKLAVKTILNELLNDLPYHLELSDDLSELYYYELLEKKGYKMNSLELVSEFTERIFKELKD